MKPSIPSLRSSEMEEGPEKIFLRSLDLFNNFFTEFEAGAEEFQAELVEGRLAVNDKLAQDAIRMILNLKKILDPIVDKDEAIFWTIQMKTIESFMNIHVKAVTAKRFVLDNPDHPSSEKLEKFLRNASAILKGARLDWIGFKMVKAHVSEVKGNDAKNRVKTEEMDDTFLIPDDKNKLIVKPDDCTSITMEDCEGLEKVEGDLDKIQYPENKENDENGENHEEPQNVALLLDDNNSPVDDQCQKDVKVSWVGAITSSNTRQCLDSSPVLSPTRLLSRIGEEQEQNQETHGEEIDDENLDSVQENVETVLLVEDEVEGDVNKVKVLDVKVNVNNEKCVKMKEPEDIVAHL